MEPDRKMSIFSFHSATYSLTCIFSSPKAALLKANKEPHMKHGNDESKFHIAFIGQRADVPLSPVFLITDFDSKRTARIFIGLGYPLP